MTTEDRAMEIIDDARKAYLREVLGWDEATVQAFEGEPALWVKDAVMTALRVTAA